MEFYKRHLCRGRAVAGLARRVLLDPRANPEVYHAMNGPSEFHVIGTIKDWDITERLGQIEAPTLVFSGRYDEVTPAITEAAHRAIPGPSTSCTRRARTWRKPRSRSARSTSCATSSAGPSADRDRPPAAGAVAGRAVRGASEPRVGRRGARGRGPRGLAGRGSCRGCSRRTSRSCGGTRRRSGSGPWIVIAAGEVVGSAGSASGGRTSGRESSSATGSSRGTGTAATQPRAARALVAWALAQPNVEQVVARSELSNDASNRVLEKLGLTRVRARAARRAGSVQPAPAALELAAATLLLEPPL